MHKLNVLTFFVFLISCDVPVGNSGKIKTKPTVKVGQNEVDNDEPTGKIPIPNELRIETQNALELDQDSATALAKELAEEISR